MNKTIIKIVLVSLLGMVLISCEPSCDISVEVYNADNELIGWECITNNQN